MTIEKSKTLPLTYRYEQDCANRSNQPFREDKLIAYIDSAEVGYLVTEYIPKENLKIFFPTIWHYLVSMEGKYIFAKFLKSSIDLSDPNLYEAVVRDMGGFSNSLPDSDKRKAIITDYIRKNRDKFQSMVNWNVDKPKVGYITVLEEYRRLGIGLQLYTATAKLLAEQGFPLYASKIQSPAAASAWSYMQTHGFPIRNVTTRYRGTTEKRLILDYRK